MPNDSISAAVEALREAFDAFTLSATEQGWAPTFFSAQVALVIACAPRIPGVDMHDSTCEFASAYCAVNRLQRHVHDNLRMITTAVDHVHGNGGAHDHCCGCSACDCPPRSKRRNGGRDRW